MKSIQTGTHTHTLFDWLTTHSLTIELIESKSIFFSPLSLCAPLSLYILYATLNWIWLFCLIFQPHKIICDYIISQWMMMMLLMLHAQRVCVVLCVQYAVQYAHKFTLYNSHPSTYSHILCTTHSHSRRSRLEILCYICGFFSLCYAVFCFSTVDILQLTLIHKYVRGCFTANHHHLISSLLISAQLRSLTSFVRILSAATMHGVNNSWMSAFDACHKRVVQCTSICERWFPRIFNQLSSQTQLDAFPSCVSALPA